MRYVDCLFRDRRYQFNKRRQFLISTHDETLSVVAMCVSNPDCSPLRIQISHAAPTPSGFPGVCWRQKTGLTGVVAVMLVGANSSTRLRSQDAINGPVIVTSASEPAL